MPVATNLTVKKNDGTTDIVHTLMTPSSGDKTPAVWRSNTVGSSVRERPEFRVQSYDSPDGQRRIIKEHLTWPVTRVIGGVTELVGISQRTVETRIVKLMHDAEVNEFASQGANLSATTVVKDSVKSGFAPT